MLTRPLAGAQGQWIWIPADSYIYSGTMDGMQIESGKIVVL
jgi:hypothetical protein